MINLYKQFIFLRKNFSILAIFTLIAFSACDSSDSGSSQGNSPGNPFEVYDVVTLQKVGKASGEGWTLSAHYKLTANITVSGTWVPIGSYSSPFTGSFDGNGKTISGIYTPNSIGSSSSSRGFFGFIDTGGKVKNLGLLNVNIRGHEYIGGVVGYNRNGTIENCYTAGVVGGTAYIGGVVGANDEGTVQNCYSTSAISVSNTINNSNYCNGGVVGANWGTVQNCYATGSITGVEDVGGVVGYNEEGTVQNCYATGDITGVDHVGGVVGYNVSSTVQRCVALNTTITGSGTGFGRVVGFATTGLLLTNYANQDMNILGGGSFTNPSNILVLLSATQSPDWWATSPGVWSGVWGMTDTAPWQWNSTEARPKLYFEP